MAWFERDHTGRPLAESERQFLSALIELLSEVRPAQIDASETALTAEGDSCLIVLIPHRALGGIAIVVWLTAQEGQVTLASIGEMDRHDDIDLGVCVSTVELNAAKPDFAPLLERIRLQLFAPLTVRWYAADQANVLADDSRGVLRQVGHLGPTRGWWFPSTWRKVIREAQIRFVDSEAPPITEPSGVDKWFSTRPKA